MGMVRPITWKKVGIFLLFLFFCFFVFRAPQESANVTRDVFGTIAMLGKKIFIALTDFLQALF